MSLAPALAIASLPPPISPRCDHPRGHLRHQHFAALRFNLSIRRSKHRLASVVRAASGDSSNLSPPPPPKQGRGWIWLSVAAISGFLAVGYIVARRVIASAASSGQISQSGSGFLFTADVLGRKISLGERTPGWIYFLLLMAAGFGLFVSEEALNVWVGATIARTLIWNSTGELFWNSIVQNISYISSTILWVYWGVCISDMVPFYAGKLAAQAQSGSNIREKLGISKEKLDSIAETVRLHGNLIGFIERFSIGARNPTSFLAGASGIDPSIYFAGVCAGAVFTLPLQLSVGFVLRERPVAALAGVAAFVGIWTILPYLTAALLSISLFKKNNQNQPQ